MKFKHILILASALAVLAGCKKSEEVEPAKVSLKPGTIAVSGAGDTKTLSVTANGEWNASVNKEWVHIAPISGNASTKSITVLVDENTTGAERSAVITVICGSAKGEATVNQSADAAEEGTIANADDFLAFVKDAVAATEADEFNITADIDLDGAVITPIPAFAGVLDGNNHKVYNYKVVSKEMTSGLILTNNGVVKNLILGSSDGSSYDGKSEVGFDGNQESAPSHIGGVCAVNAGTIENVKQFAKVVTTVGNTAVTGISGLVGAITSPATVKDCENHASVVATGTTAGETYIAGVAGYVNNADALIDHCVNKAPVEVTIAIVKASMFAGVVARCNLGAKVVDCQNLAPVKYIWSDQGQSGNYIMVAGVVGALYTTSSAIRCVNKAAVSSTNQQVTRMGGVVGTLNSQGTVEECVNEGEINLTVANPNVNWQSVAGVVGFEEKVNNGNVIRKNVNKGNVNVDVNITGTHSANRVHAGGILGLGNLGVELYENTNEANITAINRASASGSNATQMEVGGIVGGLRGEGSFSRENENKGAVSCTGPENAMAGGIAGHMGTLAGATDDALLTMENDKNTGAVVGSDATKTGSIAGVSTATITGSTAAGSVNGTTLTDDNFVKLAVGTNTGKLVDLKSPTGGTASSKELSAAPKEIRVEADDTSASFEVTANVAWTVSTAADWITSYTNAGTNNGTVTIAFPAYTGTDADRVAEFTVSGDGVDPVVVTLTQGKVLDEAPKNIPSLAELELFAIESKKETPDFSRWQDGEGVVNIVADIDASSADFLPITLVPASLVINGNNHAIKLALDADATHVALFKTVKGALKNIVVNGSVKSKLSTGAEHFACGLVCSLEEGGHIENCINNASITASGKVPSDYSKYCYASGLVGIYKGDGTYIKGCVNNGDILVDGDNISMAAGIAAYGAPAANITTGIENCVNHGNIVLNHGYASTPNKWGYCGGVVAKIGSTASKFMYYYIKNSSFDGNITIDKSEKIRCGGILGNSGYAANYDIKDCAFSGTITVNSTEAVDRIIGGIGPGFSEAQSSGTVSNSVFSGKILAKGAGNIYFGGIYGNNGAATMVIDNCKTTAASEIDGGSAPKSIAMVAARPNAAGMTIKNCKIAGKITSYTPAVDETPASYGDLLTITAENIADWMWKGTGTTVAVTLTDNGFNNE